MAPVPAPDPYAALGDSLRALALRGQQRRFKKGYLLIQEGDLGDTLFVLLSGRVKAFSSDERDHEIVFGFYGPGEYLGEMSLDGGPRSASVMALETTVCAVITRQTLRAFIGEHPEFAFELLGRVIQRARIATRSARNMALLDVYGRLVQMFGELATTLPDGTRVIEQRLTHHDIAGLVGCSREMVSRLMKDLTAGGHVRSQGGSLWLSPNLPPRW